MARALVAAIADAALEREQPIRTYFDSQIVIRTVFGASERDRTFYDRASLLVRALWSRGFLGPVHLLHSHAAEVDEHVDAVSNAPQYADRLEYTVRTLESLGAAAVANLLLERASKPGQRPQDHEELLRFARRHAAAFFATAELTMGSWQQRLARLVTEGPLDMTVAGHSIDALSSDKRLWELDEELGRLPARQEYTRSNLADATALLSIKLQRQAGEHVRFFTETPSLIQLGRTSPLIGSVLGSSTESSSAALDEPGGVLRSAEYFLARALLPSLRRTASRPMVPGPLDRLRSLDWSLLDQGLRRFASAENPRHDLATVNIDGVWLTDLIASIYDGELLAATWSGGDEQLSAAIRHLVSRLTTQPSATEGLELIGSRSLASLQRDRQVHTLRLASENGASDTALYDLVTSGLRSWRRQGGIVDWPEVSFERDFGLCVWQEHTPDGHEPDLLIDLQRASSDSRTESHAASWQLARRCASVGHWPEAFRMACALSSLGAPRAAQRCLASVAEAQGISREEDWPWAAVAFVRWSRLQQRHVTRKDVRDAFTLLSQPAPESLPAWRRHLVTGRIKACIWTHSASDGLLRQPQGGGRDPQWLAFDTLQTLAHAVNQTRPGSDEHLWAICEFTAVARSCGLMAERREQCLRLLQAAPNPRFHLATELLFQEQLDITLRVLRAFAPPGAVPSADSPSSVAADDRFQLLLTAQGAINKAAELLVRDTQPRILTPRMAGMIEQLDVGKAAVARLLGE